MNYLFQRSVIGGSFDHLHIGHKHLMEIAFANSKFVVIGLTSDQMTMHKKFQISFEDYQTRYKNLIDFLHQKSYQERYDIIKISNIYGQTLEDNIIQAIFITENTNRNALIINEKRKELNLKPLQIINVGLVKGDDGLVVSSERIRGGEISVSGKSYTKFIEDFKSDLILPDSLRSELAIPFGKVYKDYDSVIAEYNRKDFVVTIGDIVSANFIQHHKQSSISVIDLKTRREHIYKSFLQSYFPSLPSGHLFNPPGTINIQTAINLRKHIQDYLHDYKNKIIVIDGEEDLLVLPFILFLPLGSLVIYGLYNRGMVVVEVSLKNKEEAKQLLSKFSVSIS